MSSFLRDYNRVPTLNREGNAIGGKLSLSGSDLTADSWYRLMPGSNTGALVDDNDRKLNIGTLRSDILEIEQWNLVILNQGYIDYHLIVDHIGNEVTLKKPIAHINGLKNAGLGSAIEFVMFPTLLNPLGINYKSGPAADMQIGVFKDDVYNPVSTEIKELDDIPAGELLMLNCSRIDRIFYRFPTVDSGTTYVFSWGEHYRG